MGHTVADVRTSFTRILFITPMVDPEHVEDLTDLLR